MVADQRKKRLNAASITGPSRDQHKFKRKKPRFSGYDLDMRSYVSLEWDDGKKSVVAKREQIGISRRDVIHFVDALPPGRNVLADVITVPPEIFELEDLSKVLTHEVWQTCLSEHDRSLLTQFLPKGADTDEVVQELLGGDNFHFGNPFRRWGSLLCSGNYHPDSIVYREQCFKSSKKAYYLDLRKYHIDMIENLQMWKERLASCKDPKEEIVHSIWRKGFTTSPLDNSSDGIKAAAKPRKGEKLRKHNVQHSDGAKYMSYIKVSKAQHQRVKSSMKSNSNSIQPKSLNNVLGNIEALHVQPFEVYEEEERQKLHEHWLRLATRDVIAGFSNWSARRLQRSQLMKSLGQELEVKLKSQKEGEESSDDRMSEEMNNEDIGAERTLLRGATHSAEDVGAESTELRGVTHNVEDVGSESTELREGVTHNVEVVGAVSTVLRGVVTKNSEHIDAESTVLSGGVTHNAEDAGAKSTMTMETPVMTAEDEHKQPDSSDGERMDDASANSEPVGLEDEEGENMDSEAYEQRHIVTTNPGTADNSGLLSMENDHVQHTISLDDDGSHHYKNMNIEFHGDHVNQTTDKSSSSKPETPENLNHVDVPMNQENHLVSAVDSWHQVGIPQSYYQSTSLSHGYSSASEMSRGHPQVEEAPVQLINLEAENREKDAGKHILQRPPDDMSFFSPYPHQDRNELLQSFFKNENNMPYQHVQKQTGLEFQPAANVMIETGQFTGQIRDQIHSSLPFEFRQKGLGDLYMHQNIQESMYSDGGRYSMDRPENLPLNQLNVPEWTVNNVRMSLPSQSHLNGGDLLGQNWFSGDNQTRGGWSCVEGAVGPSQSIGSGNRSDQSLFSVLSECNELRPCGPYESVSSAGRFMQPGSYVGGVHPTGNVLQQSSNPLNYLSGHEAAASFKASSLGWMNAQHQNPSLEESIAKPFLRSWHQ